MLNEYEKTFFMTIHELTLENLQLLNTKKYFQLLRHLSDTISTNETTSLTTILHSSHIHIFLYGTFDNPVGTITCLLEPKTIHNGMYVAHIEDVVVDPEARGQGVARQLVDHVRQFAQQNHCYKILLHCHPSLHGLYSSMGFSNQNLYGMRLDVEDIHQVSKKK
jgi:GNAT superfamily N-acetyltransferase